MAHSANLGFFYMYNYYSTWELAFLLVSAQVITIITWSPDYIYHVALLECPYQIFSCREECSII